jgi:integrase
MTTPRGPHGGTQKLRAFKLTPAFVRRICTETPPEREIAYADQNLPRHYVRVRPPSRPGQPWPAESRIRYTLPGGRRVWLVTGNPRTMPLPALRAAARAALAIVDAGGDPTADRAQRAAAWTVRALWAAYSASSEFARCTPEVRRAITGWFVLHILPRIGNEKLAAIDVPMVRRLIRAVTTDTRNNERKRRLGGPSAARKVARLLSTALTWAVGEGQRERNPLRGALRLDGDRVRETVITQPAEYVALFEAMDRMVAAKKLRPTARAFLIVAALTGMRKGELRTLTWDQIDLAERRVTLTDTKGAKLARRGVRQESISLPPLAATALAEILPAETFGAARVFAPRQGRLLSVDADWTRIKTAAALPPDLTLHGLRHSIGTTAVLAGLSGPEVQALLRHRSAAVSAKYIHLADQVTQRLQDRATAHLIEAMGTTPSAEIPSLPRKRRA